MVSQSLDNERVQEDPHSLEGHNTAWVNPRRITAHAKSLTGWNDMEPEDQSSSNSHRYENTHVLELAERTSGKQAPLANSCLRKNENTHFLEDKYGEN